MNSLYKLSQLIENSTHGADIDKSKTLTGWHKRAAAVRGAVLQLAAERDAKIADANENYKNAALDAAIDAANADFDAAARIARDKVETDLQSVLDSKRRAWSKANDAPSTEMLNMLTALQMRGTDLTDDEIIATIEKLNDNAVALRSLRSICNRAGIALPEFVGSSPEAFEKNMEEAEQYARKGIESLTTNTDDLPYMARLFWERPGAALDNVYFAKLDKTTLTSAMIERVEPDDADKEKEVEEP